MLERIKKYREDLHQIPEIGLDVPKTCAYICNILKDLDCEITHPIPNSVCAYFNNGKAKTIAYRSDMDALETLEQNNFSFKSKHVGKMHACGHDGHMAILLASAYQFNQCYQKLDYNILLIFQPGEETPGGAKPILDTKLFEKYNVTYVFGYHLWPHLPKGTIATKPNAMMARVSELSIDIKGKSAHIAKYEQGIDTIIPTAYLITRLYQKAEIKFKDSKYILRFGNIHGGTVRNVVANHTRIEGSIRAFDDHIFNQLKQLCYEVVSEIKNIYQVEIEITFSEGYPAVYNDETLLNKIKSQSPYPIEILTDGEMISEDFAFYQQQAKGIFFFLGSGKNINLHSDYFDFEIDALLSAINMNLAIARMNLED